MHEAGPNDLEKSQLHRTKTGQFVGDLPKLMMFPCITCSLKQTLSVLDR